MKTETPALKLPVHRWIEKKLLFESSFPDAKRAFAAGMFPEIAAFDLAEQTVRKSISLPLNGFGSLAVSPDGTRLVSAARDTKFDLWDVESRSHVAGLYGHERRVFAIDVSADGQTIASVGLDGDLSLWASGENDRRPTSPD